MNILWRVLGFHGIKIHVAALETPVRSHMSHSLPSVWPTVPIAAAAQSRGSRRPQRRREPNHRSTLRQVSVVFLFGGKWESSVLCQWSCSIFWEWFLDGKCVACFIHNRRGEGSRKSRLRLFPAAPWDQQSCWRAQGMLEEQEPAQKLQKRAVQAGRDRVWGGFSAKRGAAEIKYVSLLQDDQQGS